MDYTDNWMLIYSINKRKTTIGNAILIIISVHSFWSNFFISFIACLILECMSGISHFPLKLCKHSLHQIYIRKNDNYEILPLQFLINYHIKLSCSINHFYFLSFLLHSQTTWKKEKRFFSSSFTNGIVYGA